jgi:AcrR family transcriptional regulator
VSPGLVIHHFGSKEALQVACDEHVARTIREAKRAAVQQGTAMDPLAVLRGTDRYGLTMRYLARMLTDDSPHAAELVDELVNDAVGYIAEGVHTGLMRPTDDPHGQAAVLTVWSLGALVLHEHVQRLLGVDLGALDDDPAAIARYWRPAAEIIGKGVLTDEAYQAIEARIDEAAQASGDTSRQATRTTQDTEGVAR